MTVKCLLIGIGCLQNSLFSPTTPRTMVDRRSLLRRTRSDRWLSSKKKVLYGREEEESTLQERYRWSCCPQPQKQRLRRTKHGESSVGPQQQQEVVMVSGPSGVGKTTLARTLKHTVVREGGGIFVTADFDSTNSATTKAPTTPYEAMATALTDVVEILVLLEGHTRYVQKQMHNTPDLHLLTDLVPSLTAIVGQPPRNQQLLQLHHPKLSSSSSSSLLQRKQSKDAKLTTTNGRKRRHPSPSSPLSTKIHNHQHHHQQQQQLQQQQQQQLQQPHAQHYQHHQPCSVALHAVIAKFLRVVASPHDFPVVLFLDNLHNADAASLELLRVLATTTTTTMAPSYKNESGKNIHKSSDNDDDDNDEEPPSGLLIVAAYKERRDLGVFLQDLREEPTVALTRIKLENFSSLLVNTMVNDMLQLDTGDTETAIVLTSVLMQQTGGNVRRVLSLLRFLTDQGILVPAEGAGRWELHGCDGLLPQNDNQDNGTATNDNNNSEQSSSQLFVRFLAERMRLCLSSKALRVLRVASCMMDTSIDDSALRLMVGRTVAYELEEAEKAGFLTFVPQRGGYSFADDHARQAAFSLIDARDVASFQLRLGQTLWREAGPQILESDNVFVVVNLLYRGVAAGASISAAERLRLADLHLTAGDYASSVSSFGKGETYYSRGIELLGNDAHWNDRYGLTLALHNGALECAVCNTNYGRVRDLTKLVFQHTHRVEDKLSAYRAMILSMEEQPDRVDRVRDVGWTVLKELGETMPTGHAGGNPRRSLVGTTELLRTKTGLRGVTLKQLLRRRGLRDSRRIAAFELLNVIAPYLLVTCCPTYLVPLATRIVRLSWKHGLHRRSCVGFALYGMLSACCLGRVREGLRFAQLSLSVVQLDEYKKELPVVYGIVYSTIHHLASPLRESLDCLKYAARISLETGNIGYYALNRITYCNLCFFAGLNLAIVKQEIIRPEATLSKHRHRRGLTDVLSPLLQFIQNTVDSGVQGNMCVLTGDYIIDFDTSVDEWIRYNNQAALVMAHVMSALLAYLYNDYQLAQDVLNKMELNPKIQSPASLIYPPMVAQFVPFLEGLIHVALMRLYSTDAGMCRRLKQKVQACLKQVTKSAKLNPSVHLHKQRLLEAELESTSLVLSMNSNHNTSSRSINSSSNSNNNVIHNKMEEARRLYGEAIELAKLQGCLHEAAIACERTSEHMRRIGDGVLHGLYRKKARVHYLQWGASGKALRLRPQPQL